MVSTIKISIDGREATVEAGLSVAAALINEGVWQFRAAGDGSPRGPICAMGVCFECRVTIDGRPHRRSCMELCRSGMEVETGG